ncbi:acyl-CoA N-acyltransferase [Entophlyctis helioformis]|nr:acyl-CoA N-acyltransferase [Entophlyctis helioformis]
MNKTDAQTSGGPRVRYVVQDAAVADAEAMTRIINAAYRGSGGWTTEQHLVAENRIDTDELVDTITGGVIQVLSLKDADTGAVLGTIEIEAYDEAAKEPVHTPGAGAAHSGVLLGLFAVEPAFQSRGAGSFLVKAALDRARAAGKTNAYMWVIHSRSELLAWYKRLGFKPTGHTVPFPSPERLKIADGHFDELVYAL